MPAPFKIVPRYEFGFKPRGTVYHRRYRLDRGGFTGPIEVRLADRQARHLQGVLGPTVVVPSGASDFVYPLRLPPWMEVGRTSRTVLAASAVIHDADGSEHEVSFSSPEANTQIATVVGPGRLALELACRSVSAAPGQAAAVPLRVTRARELRGPVRLELVVPAHLRGIAAQPFEIPADRDEGVLALTFDELPAAVNAPLVVRATARDAGEPVVAESELEVVVDR